MKGKESSTGLPSKAKVISVELDASSVFHDAYVPMPQPAAAGSLCESNCQARQVLFSECVSSALPRTPMAGAQEIALQDIQLQAVTYAGGPGLPQPPGNARDALSGKTWFRFIQAAGLQPLRRQTSPTHNRWLQVRDAKCPHIWPMHNVPENTLHHLC